MDSPVQFDVEEEICRSNEKKGVVGPQAVSTDPRKYPAERKTVMVVQAGLFFR